MQHTINMNKVNEVSQSCPTLCDPMDCSLPGSSTHGILQARVLECVAISFSRGSSQPRIEPRSPTLQEDAIPSEPPGKPYFNMKYLTSNFTHPNSLSQVFMVFFASGSKMSLISVSCCAFLPLLHLSWSLIHHHTNPVQEPLPFPMHPAHLCLSDLFL